MKVFTSVKELRAELDRTEQSGIGFVPTMGALHAGHRSLVERARRENATVVVSVFVNPTQFAPHEDLDAYPRTEAADAEKLSGRGDLIFAQGADKTKCIGTQFMYMPLLVGHGEQPGGNRTFGQMHEDIGAHAHHDGSEVQVIVI